MERRGSSLVVIISASELLLAGTGEELYLPGTGGSANFADGRARGCTRQLRTTNLSRTQSLTRSDPAANNDEGEVGVSRREEARKGRKRRRRRRRRKTSEGGRGEGMVTIDQTEFSASRLAPNGLFVSMVYGR